VRSARWWRSVNAQLDHGWPLSDGDNNFCMKTAELVSFEKKMTNIKVPAHQENLLAV